MKLKESMSSDDLVTNTINLFLFLCHKNSILSLSLFFQLNVYVKNGIIQGSVIFF